MITYVGGPVYPLGSNREKYYVTFTGVGSLNSFVIPIKHKSHFLQSMIFALTYALQVRKVATSIVHSDNFKYFVAKATVEATRQLSANLQTTTP